MMKAVVLLGVLLAGGQFWQPSVVNRPSSSTGGLIGAVGAYNAKQRAKACLRTPQTEQDCKRNCPGVKVGDCLRRVRGEQ